MKLIQAKDMPTPGGHYAQAVEENGFLFLSGMLPPAATCDPATSSFEQQCEAVFAQCAQVLGAAGCGFGDVVQCTVYLVGVERWAAFNQVYARTFGAHTPARAVVPVPALHFGYLIEVQITATLANRPQA